MGRVGLLPGDHPADFFKLFDQVNLGVQAAGGVDEQDVDAAAFSRLHSVEYHC